MTNSTAYVDGWMAYYADTSLYDNPYPPEKQEKYKAWHEGWDDAEQDAMRNPHE